jgi:translation initiation factor IF-3
MKKEESKLRINNEIKSLHVRLVGDNVEQGIYDIHDALNIAEELGCDLIEISPNALPPVCRVMEYQKYLYQQKKKQKELKARQKQTELKELRFGPNMGENDYQVKLKHAEEFLHEGNKVKAIMMFKGREIAYAEQGKQTLLRFAIDLEKFGNADSMPILEGRRMNITISPKKR